MSDLEQFVGYNCPDHSQGHVVKKTHVYIKPVFPMG